MRLLVRGRSLAGVLIALMVAAGGAHAAQQSSDPGEQIKDGAVSFGEGIKNGAIKAWEAVKSGANTVGEKLSSHPAPPPRAKEPEPPPATGQ